MTRFACVAMFVAMSSLGCGKGKSGDQGSGTGAASASTSGSAAGTAAGAGTASASAPDAQSVPGDAGAGSAGAAGSGAAAGSAAGSAAAAVPLRVSGKKVGALEIGTPVDKAKLDALVGSGYTVVETEDSFEGEAYTIYEVKKGEATVLRINPEDGKISSILVLGALPSDEGVEVGMAFPAVAAKLGEMSCEVEYHDDPVFSNGVTCHGGLWIVVFENTTKLGEGKPVPAKKQNKLMAKSKVVGLVIR